MSGQFEVWRRIRAAVETLRDCRARGGVKVDGLLANWPAGDTNVLDEYLKQGIALRLNELLTDAADLAETSERTLASGARAEVLSLLDEIDTPVGDCRQGAGNDG